jgi:hypothetical protein
MCSLMNGAMPDLASDAASSADTNMISCFCESPLANSETRTSVPPLCPIQYSWQRAILIQERAVQQTPRNRSSSSFGAFILLKIHGSRAWKKTGAVLSERGCIGDQPQQLHIIRDIGDCFGSEGTSENSPAVHCRVKGVNRRVPKGRLKNFSRLNRPFGTKQFWGCASLHLPIPRNRS